MLDSANFSQSKASVVSQAVKQVAPSWPLQSIVAVNPFWNQRDQKFFQSLARLSTLFGQNLFLSLEGYLKKYEDGLVGDQDIHLALQSLKKSGAGYEGDFSRFMRESRGLSTQSQGFNVYSDFVARLDAPPISEDIIGQVGKYCASYFDKGQASFGLSGTQKRLFEVWLELIQLDRSMDYLGYSRPAEFLAKLPSNPLKAIELCAEKLGIRSLRALECYVTKVCYRTVGWGSHISYHHWQKSLGLEHNDRGTTVEDLVAMFMVYEVWCMARLPVALPQWLHFLEKQEATFADVDPILDSSYLLLAVWQRANEWAYQRQVAKTLIGGSVQPPSHPIAQMVFCIDVRSEVIRRKIEDRNPNITTHGFAGFFGMGLDCSHKHEETQSYRCPVLLTPKVAVTEDANARVRSKIRSKRSLGKFLSGLKQGLVSSFAYVEFFGVLAGWEIFKRSFNFRPNLLARLRDRFDSASELVMNPDLASQVNLASFALTHMGIRDFAPLVLVCGHGSVTTNNAFASSLDCGACGGHSGELNARVLCNILNSKEVRAELSKRGEFNLSEQVHFIPAVHETVSDRILILEEQKLVQVLGDKANEFRWSLAKAAVDAQHERAALYSGTAEPSENRVSNWSEVRPEWALVRNASFVVAPRSRTRGTSLSGRSFLHDYDHTIDAGMKTLELIMTAPMVVTNWINMQYYASSVAMSAYGSGNKVLHNVVGRLGVTEGNGGDLRTGLPFQSVHNGEQLVHDPLRLSVFIEAPTAELEKIIGNHEVVKQLVDNQWLHLFAIDRASNTIKYRNPGGDYESVEGLNAA